MYSIQDSLFYRW